LKKMKKNLTVLLAALLIGGTAFGQAVSDRNIIPVAVNLNQVLRMTITNGGNIEFVFNTIDEYKDGISGDVATSASANDAATEPMYQTDFTVASSTRWAINYGAEQATFIGTDNPGNIGLALDNVGFSIEETGAHDFETGGTQGGGTGELWSNPTDGAQEVAALQVYPIALIEDNNLTDAANAGDATDNRFTLVWRCGTSESLAGTTPMNATSLIEQSVTPDRYVANVLFELAVDN
jgi:hypothetical protein